MDFELPILAPSILAADFTKLGAQIEECEGTKAQWIHCDIMDGHFVPNISYGSEIVNAAARTTDSFLDVHLMIENPDKYIESFADAGADQLTVHYEACPHLHRTIQNIHLQGITAGVAVNPGTSLHAIESIIDFVDLVLIMSVNPGFGGQSFIETTYQRLRDLRQLRSDRNLGFLIEVDGGVRLDNIEKITRSGADVLVAGSSVFKARNIPKRIQELYNRAQMGTGKMV